VLLLQLFVVCSPKATCFWMKRGWGGSDVLDEDVIDEDGHALCILFIHCCLLSYPTFLPPLPLSWKTPAPSLAIPAKVERRNRGIGCLLPT
jgi:hypothetical protein